MRVLLFDSQILLSVLPFIFFQYAFLSHLFQLTASFEIMDEQPQRGMKVADGRTLSKDFNLESKFWT